MRLESFARPSDGHARGFVVVRFQAESMFAVGMLPESPGGRMSRGPAVFLSPPDEQLSVVPPLSATASAEQHP